MKQDKNFLNALDDWGTILTDTYEKNARLITMEGKDIPLNIDYMDGDHVNYVKPNGINSLQINKIYNGARYASPIEGEFNIVKEFNKLIIFYVNYEDLLINNIPTGEFILNMFEEDPQNYRFAKIRKTKSVIFTLVYKNNKFVLGNGYKNTFDDVVINIAPYLKNKMIEEWKKR